MTGVICASIVLPYLTFKNFSNSLSFKVGSTTSWYFFVLINAFYGGALTMFFTTKTTIPFATIKDVMRAYPDWKLMMLKVGT